MKGGEKVVARPMIEACAELDYVEGRAWDRIGGPSTGDFRKAKAIEAEIGERAADSHEVARWRRRRLDRAISNEWIAELLAPLVRAVEQDRAIFGI